MSRFQNFAAGAAKKRKTARFVAALLRTILINEL